MHYRLIILVVAFLVTVMFSTTVPYTTMIGGYEECLADAEECEYCTKQNEVTDKSDRHIQIVGAFYSLSPDDPFAGDHILHSILELISAALFLGVERGFVLAFSCLLGSIFGLCFLFCRAKFHIKNIAFSLVANILYLCLPLLSVTIVGMMIWAHFKGMQCLPFVPVPLVHPA